MIGVVEAAKRATSVITIAGLLAGCATAAQRQYQAMASNNQSAVQDLRTCSETVYNSPEFAVPLSRPSAGADAAAATQHNAIGRNRARFGGDGPHR